MPPSATSKHILRFSLSARPWGS